jgi:peptidylamidoglycolate lyase
MSRDQLFNRRTFLQTAAATTAAVAVAVGSSASAKEAPVKFGSGKVSFELDADWAKLPAGQKYGLGCAVVVDSSDRIIVTSRSADPCVVIFDKTGKIVETWSKNIGEKIGYDQQQYVATAHGLYHSKEGDKEFLYWTENVHAPKGGKRIGARVYKTDLTGKIVYQLGNVDAEGETSQKFNFTNPTDVAVAPNGDIYIVDGYGSQLVHRFDKNFKLIKTMGGPGKDHGKFNTCHGVWVSTLRKEPEIYIADRANGRLEVYSPELEYKRTIPGMLAPCCFYQHDGLIYVPELNARVTVIDADDKVVAHLGDGEKVKADLRATTPDVFSLPHALTLDSKGNLYVVEWVPFGRPRKLTRV